MMRVGSHPLLEGCALARRGPLSSVEDLVVPAVEATLASLPLASVDGGAARLARVYARALDDAAGIEDVEARALAVSRVGPRLLTALESLGATPRARGLMTRAQGSESKPPVGRLASIRGSV